MLVDLKMGEFIMDYLGGSNIIIRALRSGRGRQKREESMGNVISDCRKKTQRDETFLVLKNGGRRPRNMSGL